MSVCKLKFLCKFVCQFFYNQFIFSIVIKKKKISIAGKILLIINILFITCLLISYLAPFINPAKNWLIAFFGLAYPIFVLLNLVFVIIWLFRRRWLFLLSIATILVGWNMLSKHVRYCIHCSKAPPEHTFKVISFNVRNFDVYNYTKKWEYQFGRRNKIFDILKLEAPDIVCFQEFFFEKTGKFKTIDTLVQFLKASNYHAEYSASSKSINFFGIATFTDFPIINKGIVSKSSGNLCIYTDVLINADTVRIYNAHLESIRLGPEDYKFAEKVSKIDKINADEKMQLHSKRILNRMKRAFIKRGPQADNIAEHIKLCRYPIIFCGDFNDTPASYSYQTISKELTDCFVESGSGIGNTYLGIFPSFRIDYIFHSKQFTSYQFETIHTDVSDHYPIKCFLKNK